MIMAKQPSRSFVNIPFVSPLESSITILDELKSDERIVEGLVSKLLSYEADFVLHLSAAVELPPVRELLAEAFGEEKSSSVPSPSNSSASAAENLSIVVVRRPDSILGFLAPFVQSQFVNHSCLQVCLEHVLADAKHLGESLAGLRDLEFELSLKLAGDNQSLVSRFRKVKVCSELRELNLVYLNCIFLLLQTSLLNSKRDAEEAIKVREHLKATSLDSRDRVACES